MLAVNLDERRRDADAFLGLWGFHDKKPHIPSAAELAMVRPLVDYRHVLLDAEHRTVRFAHPGVELDLGGIAKGFACFFKYRPQFQERKISLGNCKAGMTLSLPR